MSCTNGFLETKFEFKLVVYEYDHVQRWEDIGTLNRKFKVRYYKSQVHCVEGDPIARETVIEKLEDSFSSLEIGKKSCSYTVFIVMSYDRQYDRQEAK